MALEALLSRIVLEAMIQVERTFYFIAQTDAPADDTTKYRFLTQPCSLRSGASDKDSPRVPCPVGLCAPRIQVRPGETGCSICNAARARQNQLELLTHEAEHYARQAILCKQRVAESENVVWHCRTCDRDLPRQNFSRRVKKKMRAQKR